MAAGNEIAIPSTVCPCSQLLWIVVTAEMTTAPVVEVLEAGGSDGVFSLIDTKLTAYAIIAHSSHVGTWYRPDGRMSVGDVAEVYVDLALRMVDAESLPSDDVQRLVANAESFHATQPT